MGSTAEFHRTVRPITRWISQEFCNGRSNRNHPDGVWVTLTEHGSQSLDGFGGFKRRGPGGHRKILTDGLSHQRLHLLQVFRGRSRRSGVIESKTIWFHQRTTLVRLFTDHRSQSKIEQVGRRVVGFDARTTFNIQTCAQRLPRTQRSGLHHPHMKHEVAAAFGAVNPNTDPFGLEGAGISHLATHFGIKIGLIQDDRHFVAGLGLFHQITSDQQRANLGGAPFVGISV